MHLSEEYAYKVYKTRSFTEAAKELYISQPALSASISRLEGELGFRIFDRSTVPIALTVEGRIYMDHIEEVMMSESNMKMRMSQLSDLTRGNLSIGAYTYAAHQIIAAACGVFNKEHPQIEVRLDMGNIGGFENLNDKLEKQNLDLLLSYDYDDEMHEAIPILHEKLIVALHRDMPEAKELMAYSVTRKAIIAKNYPKSKEISDLSLFKNVRFFNYNSFSNTSHRMAEIFGKYKTSKYIITSVRHAYMHYHLLCEGIGAVLTSDYQINSPIFDNENIIYLIPKSPHAERWLYFIRKKGKDKNPIAESFIETTKRVLKNQ